MDRETTKTWQEYEEGLAYQRETGLSRKLPEYERFKQGDQWPAPSKRTANLPRPVFNIVNFFIRTKRANVLNQTIKMIYSPTEQGDRHAVQGAQDFTDFAAVLWNELDQDELNENFVDDCATGGTGILHYYWDSSVKGGMSLRYKGAVRGETIDPLNIFFGNPQETRLQKQPYLIISGRESVKALREEAKLHGAGRETIETIEPDGAAAEEGYDAAQKELLGAKKATVLTRYCRRNGQVYFSRATRTAVLTPETPLTPRGAKCPITLYPLAVMSWEKRKKSIFGTGEAESLLPNQKAINFNIAMMLLSVQQTAWPKILTKLGALQQQITNTPGEQLTDHYGGGGDGIKYMQPPSFPGMALTLADKVLEYSRTVSGVSEVISGEAFTSNMAASAIIALQNQSKQPIESIQKRFYRVMRDVGRIWEQFFKTYYTLPRSMTVKDGEGRESTRAFQGDSYGDVEFGLKIDVGAGSQYSEALAMASLDKLLELGVVTPDQYIELAPQHVMPFKEQLKRMREEESSTAILGQADLQGMSALTGQGKAAGTGPQMAGLFPGEAAVKGGETNEMPGM
ncbi:MAG: hypothetical protein SOX72_03735 [Oscillospiraceae bacterium]|nr:hypothetical protein [Oscillospiraceae bacterium]